MLSAV